MPHQSGFRTPGTLARGRVVASRHRVSTGGAQGRVSRRRPRSSVRRIFPLTVLGSSSTK